MKIESISKEKSSLRKEIEEKETLYRDSSDPNPKKHYENPSEVMKMRKQEEEINYKEEENPSRRDKACFTICNCIIY